MNKYMNKTIFKSISYSIFAILAVFALTISTKAFASDMVILSVTAKTDTTATGSAMVTNVKNDTTIRGSFEYATNPSFVSSQVTNETAYSLSSASAFTQTITGLTPGTTYYVRALGLGDKDGVAKPSSTLTFTTLSATVTTAPSANMLTANSNGTTSVNVSTHYSLGSSTTGNVWFEYGTSIGSYPNKTSGVSVTSSNSSYSDTINGLNVNTTYYVRSVVQTSVSTVYSVTALMVKTDGLNNNNNNGNGNNNGTVYIYGCMIKGDANYNSSATYHIDNFCAGYNNGNGNNNNNNGNNNGNWFTDLFGWGNRPSNEVVYNPIYTNGSNGNNSGYNQNGTNGNSNSNSNSSSTNTSSKTTTVSTSNSGPSFWERIFGVKSSNSTVAVKGSNNTNGRVASVNENYDANAYVAGAFWGAGNGFFPTTLIGWLLLIFLILLLIVLTRHYFYKKPKPVEVKKV